MTEVTFVTVQLNADQFENSGCLVEILNNHLVFAADVAHAADSLVQACYFAGLAATGEERLEVSLVALERLRDALNILADYDSAWQFALEPSDGLFNSITARGRMSH